jgi:hypothetical protein
MPIKMVETLTDELLVWRETLIGMRGANGTEVDAVIGRLDESIKSIAALRAADLVDKLVR